MNRLSRRIFVVAVQILLTGFLVTTTHAENGARDSRRASVANIQPRLANRYLVERDGTSLGVFAEVTGIGSENEVVEFREGGDPDGAVRKIPGRLKYSNITLKRGITSNLDLWNWRKEVEDGASPRSNVVVTLLNRAGQAVAIWSFENAWPTKVTGPSPKSSASDFGIETLEIVHERVVRLQ